MIGSYFLLEAKMSFLSGISFQVVSWGRHEAHLVCFKLCNDLCPLLNNIQCLQSHCFLHVHIFRYANACTFVFLFWDDKVNTVPLIPSWTRGLWKQYLQLLNYIRETLETYFDWQGYSHCTCIDTSVGHVCLAGAHVSLRQVLCD